MSDDKVGQVTPLRIPETGYEFYTMILHPDAAKLLEPQNARERWYMERHLERWARRLARGWLETR